MADAQLDGANGAAPLRRAELRRRAQALLLLEVAIADTKLGCHSRAYLVHRARDEVARRSRYGQRLSLLLLAADGDHGDAALQEVASAARLAVRPTDTVARWQAGELVLLLPSTGLAGATRLANRLRASVAAAGEQAGFPLGVSIGMATALGRHEGLELLIQRARAGLNEARALGGGRVGIG